MLIANVKVWNANALWAAYKNKFNFSLITRHNIACDLELHAIAIKRCFGVRQSHVQCFI